MAIVATICHKWYIPVTCSSVVVSPNTHNTSLAKTPAQKYQLLQLRKKGKTQEPTDRLFGHKADRACVRASVWGSVCVCVPDNKQVVTYGGD